MNRIAILSDRCPPLKGGGIANAHYNLYLLLKQKGFNVRIYTYLEDLKDIDRTIKEKDIYRFGSTKLEEKINGFYLRVCRKLKKIFGRKIKDKGLVYQYNIVHKANIGSRKINKHLKHFKPSIVIIPDFGAPGYALKKQKKTKYIHISHNNPMRLLNNPLLTKHSTSDAFNAIKKEQDSLLKIDQVICPSQYMKEMFNETFKFDKGVSVIPNIVDNNFIEETNKIDIHQILGIEKNIPIIYIPSAGSAIKGERYVFEIIRRISKELNHQVAFYLSGDLSKNQIYELNILNEKFKIFAPGHVTYSKNIAYVKDCEICISPTLLESFGMALLEAVFCGLPCVSFDVGGNRDVIENNINGFLVPYLNVDELIDKSLKLLLDKEGAEQIKISMQELNNNKFNSEIVIKQYISLFKQL